MITLTTIDIVLTLIPLALGTAGALHCPVDPSLGDNVPFRPSPIAFRVIWPVLFIFTGTAFAKAPRTPTNIAAYLLLSVLLSAWLFVSNSVCNEGLTNTLKQITNTNDISIDPDSGSMYIIVASVMAAFLAFGLHPTPLLAPLISWLLFAQVLGAAAVMQKKRRGRE